MQRSSWCTYILEGIVRQAGYLLMIVREGQIGCPIEILQLQDICIQCKLHTLVNKRTYIGKHRTVEIRRLRYWIIPQQVGSLLIIEVDGTTDTAEYTEVDTNIILGCRLPLQVRVGILRWRIRSLPCSCGTIIIAAATCTQECQRLIFTDAILVTRYTITESQLQVIEPFASTLQERFLRDTPAGCC